ncbi:MAG: UDP-2,4-diacetamido-2,4,6-trideoxy-beta-L-altropyranose hydrolase [Desulfovibrio sp.]|jgi:UDP-2,4-diacetamido-2,4,6-trideoxy-beta-L-altropyranose hydrolase|nr:UDP-2,4-diacetamido-2,4,6-trideoxy-beta-L-altropyranose hydrolase [Desulfovibrio sp.]
MTSLLICADASPATGAGHVMRCLALALAAREVGLAPRLVGRMTVPWLRERLAKTDIRVTEVDGSVPVRENPQDLLARMDGTKADWLALDGYHFGTDCHKAARRAGCGLLVIDDYNHLPEYHCDILLNQNPGSDDFVYKGGIGRKLLGPKYALLRPEFSAARRKAEQRVFSGSARNILLTLGGGDCSARLEHIARHCALPALAGCALTVVAGAMPEENIRTALKHCPARLEILRSVDDMPALLLATDLCVTAGGGTCWELCCLGVPFLTVEVAENQAGIVSGLQKRGFTPMLTEENFCRFMDDAELRAHVASLGLAMVSGEGAFAVAHCIKAGNRIH